jgi:hypothetical protein
LLSLSLPILPSIKKQYLTSNPPTELPVYYLSSTDRMLARTIPATIRPTLRTALPVQKRFSGHMIYDPERRRWSENPGQGWLLAVVGVGGLTYGLTLALVRGSFLTFTVGAPGMQMG